MQNLYASQGNVMAPDVASPSNLWTLVFYTDGYMGLDWYQWIPIQNEPLESETMTITEEEASITVTFPWFDSVRDLMNAIQDLEAKNDETTLWWAASTIFIAKWDDTLKKYRYAGRYMSLKTDE